MKEYTTREFKKVKGKKVYVGEPQKIMAESEEEAAHKFFQSKEPKDGFEQFGKTWKELSKRKLF